MICGSGDATCCLGGVGVERRLQVLENSLSELLERFESLVNDLEVVQDEALSEDEFQDEEPPSKVYRCSSLDDFQ